MTKTSHVALILGAALFCLTACQPTEQAGTTAPGQAQATTALSKVDVTFINKAGTSGLEEVTFAQLAETKATDPAVRGLAEKIVANFTTVNQQLAALAQSNGMTTPSEMSGPHQILYRQLQSQNGPAFNRAYIDRQLQDLTMAIETFQTEADSGSDPRVRSFAQQSLPMLLETLQTASAMANL